MKTIVILSIFTIWFGTAVGMPKLPANLKKQFEKELRNYYKRVKHENILPASAESAKGVNVDKFRDTTKAESLYEIDTVFTNDINDDKVTDYVLRIRYHGVGGNAEWLEYYILASKIDKHLFFPTHFFVGHCSPDTMEILNSVRKGKFYSTTAIRPPNGCCACMKERYTQVYHWHKGKLVLESKKRIKNKR